MITEQALAAQEGAQSEARVIGPDDLEAFNGVRKFNFGRAETEDQVGVVTGLAWTQTGGELLNIEALAVPGKGRQIKTGSLGDVMQGIDPGRIDLRAQPGGDVGHSRRLPRTLRPAHSRAGGCDPEGRAERRDRDVYGRW